MEKFKFISKNKIETLPKTAGVYAFKNDEEILYIGKAANIRERVKNHFNSASATPACRSGRASARQATFRDSLFINKVKRVGFFETGSEIEALLSESQLIKKCQPKYNIVWRDDKNYFYAGITKEELPIVFITHQIKTQISKIKNQNCNLKIKTIYIGPFIDGRTLKQTLKILRKIFPYYTQRKHPNKPCQWCHLGLCPGPDPDKAEYRKNIKNLVLVLKGRRRKALKILKKEMAQSSQSEDFEKAAKLRDQIQALEKVLANARVIEPLKQAASDWAKVEKILQKILKTDLEISRLEAYDISNIQGQEATGSMVVFINGEPDKNSYRKFKINPIRYHSAVISPKGKLFNRVKNIEKPNDIAMIKETLSRRLNHPEWPYPDAILIDGGKAQLNAAILITKKYKLKTNIMALAKRHNELFIEGRKKPILLKTLPREIYNLFLRLRDEAHRFAVSYHHKLREKTLLS